MCITSFIHTYVSSCLPPARLEQTELLFGGSEDLILLHLQAVEPHGLGQRPALTSSHDVTLLQVRLKSGRHVHRDVAVALLEPVKFLHVVKVGTTQNGSS